MLRGRKKESAHGVQVGIPHTVLSSRGREDETAFASDRFLHNMRGSGMLFVCGDFDSILGPF